MHTHPTSYTLNSNLHTLYHVQLAKADLKVMAAAGICTNDETKCYSAAGRYSASTVFALGRMCFYYDIECVLAIECVLTIGVLPLGALVLLAHFVSPSPSLPCR